jgi:uncharacterized protein
MEAKYLDEDREVDVDAVLGDIQIIDADCHFSEPSDLWTSRAPSKLRDKVPQFDTINGETWWMLDGKPWVGGLGGNVIAKGGQKRLGTLSLPLEEIDEAAYSVPERLELMDRQGVYAEVIYPNSIGFGANSMFGIEDLEFRNIVNSIYNDYLVDMQVESGDRLLPQAVLPIWDMDLTVKELGRLHEAGIRGYTITDKPHLVGLPDLDNEYFHPMWSLANEVGAVMNFHIGSGLPYAPPVEGEIVTSGDQPDIFWSSFGPQRRLATLATQFYMSNVRIIVNMCMSNMFDRYPNVKIASAESGIGWVPFVLEAMEYQLDEMVTRPEERALQTRRPKEYFRSNVYVMTWFERSAWKIIDDIGVDNVMVMTDVPHPTALYPHNREHFAKVTEHMSDEDRRKVLQDNALKVYSLDLP